MSDKESRFQPIEKSLLVGSHEYDSKRFDGGFGEIKANDPIKSYCGDVAVISTEQGYGFVSDGKDPKNNDNSSRILKTNATL